MLWEERLSICWIWVSSSSSTLVLSTQVFLVIFRRTNGSKYGLYTFIIPEFLKHMLTLLLQCVSELKPCCKNLLKKQTNWKNNSQAHISQLQVELTEMRGTVILAQPLSEAQLTWETVFWEDLFWKWESVLMPRVCERQTTPIISSAVKVWSVMWVWCYYTKWPLIHPPDPHIHNQLQSQRGWVVLLCVTLLKAWLFSLQLSTITWVS